MKKTISFILAAVVLLTMLAACGSKAPVEPAETALYGKVTMENAPATRWARWSIWLLRKCRCHESGAAGSAERPATGRDGRWRSLCHHSAV